MTSAGYGPPVCAVRTRNGVDKLAAVASECAGYPDGRRLFCAHGGMTCRLRTLD
jgi:hypothetical protein